MSATNYLLRLDVISDGKVVYSETVDQDKAKVGTLGSSTLRLNQPGVSTIHAVIERQGPAAFLLSDLGSAAGTYVNGSRIQRHVLADGDQIYFGDALVVASLVAPTAQVQGGAGQPQAQQAGAGFAGAQIPSQITLADGTVVVPYGDSGYYDNDGNYIPGYYDEMGEYHLGYGYVGENGEWVVVYGYYDTQGDWVDTDGPISEVAKEKSQWRFDGISDKRVYTESYFSNQGGDIIEVAMIWEDCVISVTNFKNGESVTISSDPNSKASYILEDPSMTSDPYTLVDTTAGSFIYVANGMRALVCRNGQEMTLEQAVGQGIVRQQGSLFAIPFDGHTSASIDIGEVTFVIHYTRIPAVILTGPSFDYAQIGFYALSFAIHILFLLLIMTIPPNSDSLNLDGFGVDDRYAELLIQAEEEEKQESPDYLDGDGEDSGGNDKQEKDSGGGDGPPSDEPADDSLPADATEEQIAMKRERDTRVAQQAGIAGVFSGGGGGLGNMFGGTGEAIGGEISGAIGAITDSAGAATAGQVQGFGGVGLATGGRGGVGSDRSMGIGGPGGGGGIGTKSGHGSGGGGGYGAKAGSRLGDRRASVPKIVPGRPTVQGSLDKEIIKRVIRQHRNEIKYCYEQQLQKDRTLAGRVLVSFTISGTGAVIIAKIAESTLKNAAVENCITGKIRRWVFPEPKGGGIARVNYPFNFSI